jgi:hypothetical protein
VKQGNPAQRVATRDIGDPPFSSMNHQSSGLDERDPKMVFRVSQRRALVPRAVAPDETLIAAKSIIFMQPYAASIHVGA